MKNKIAKALLCRAALSVFLVLTVLLASCLTELEEKVTVTFDANGGDPTPEGRELTKGDKLGSVAAPVRFGNWQFLGWYNDFDLYDENTSVYTDITLIAKYKDTTPPSSDTVTVTFSAPGAVPELVAVEVKIGKALGPLFPVDPRMKGSWFEGWVVNGVSFNKNSTVTESITATAKWEGKTGYIITLSVPEIHRAANPGIHGKRFTVFEGDSIDEWEQQFPTEMGTAKEPNDDQYHQFFRWAEGGLANGIIYTERTPITKSTTLGAIYGLYFKKNTFEVDLTTINSKVSMDEYRDGTPFWDNLDNEFKPGGDNYSRAGAAAVINNPVRSPTPLNVVINDDGSVSYTVFSAPVLMWFRPPPELWRIMKQAKVANDTQVSFYLDYEFEKPAQETDENKLNIFLGNLMQNDNWNSTEVRDLTWKDIVLGEFDSSTSKRNGPEKHKLAGTIINFDQNVDWIIFRMGRIDTFSEKNPASNPNNHFRMTIKKFTVTVEQ